MVAEMADSCSNGNKRLADSHLDGSAGSEGTGGGTAFINTPCS